MAKDKGGSPFEGSRSLSSLTGSEKVELSLEVVLGRRVCDSWTCTCPGPLSVEPVFRQEAIFQESATAVCDSLARRSSRKREQGSRESEFELKGQKMLQCSRRLN